MVREKQRCGGACFELRCVFGCECRLEKIVQGLCGVAGAMSNWMLGKGADAGDKLIEVRFLI